MNAIALWWGMQESGHESSTDKPRERNADAELQTLAGQYNSLQTLVRELLWTNQKLREELTQLKESGLSASATHPQQRPAR